jgi:hypothetical protein
MTASVGVFWRVGDVLVTNPPRWPRLNPTATASAMQWAT